MIRFVYIGDQIADGNKDFCFYDTVEDKFVEFNGECVFQSIDGFARAFHLQGSYTNLKRFLSLLDQNKILLSNPPQTIEW